MSDVFDYIVIGAGSSGCVIAERLSQDPSMRVLVLEAGGEDSNYLIDIPKGIGKLVLDPNHVWQYPVQQSREEGLSATETWIRGKVLGGSSSINGMIYVRGHPDDYDAWDRAGAKGWNWATMKRAFLAIEDHELGATDERGAGGPVHVSTGHFRYPLSEAFLKAGSQMGLPVKEDLNAGEQEGVGYYLHNIKNGRRESAAKVFLRPARKRPNVKVETGIEVERLVFDRGRAIGVAARRNGTKIAFSVRGEIILSAGAMNSPKILQQSGIGPGDHLSQVGVEVLVDNPHVGAHLLEHLGFSMPHRLKGDPGINHRFRGVGLAASALQYVLTHKGPLATGPFEIGAFARVTKGATRPDAQLFMGGFTFARGGDPTFPVQLSDVERAPGMTMYGQLLRLTSEGRLAISSSEPSAALTVTPNWLTTAEDQAAAVAMVRYMRRYMTMPAIARYVKEELSPGAQVDSDEEILRAVRRMSMCGIHAVATCRMGPAGESVVDERARVRGVTGLRVVDCSIMPGLVSGNTNAPAMAAAWHAADLIRDDAGRE